MSQSANIAAHLPAAARERPDAAAVLCPCGRDKYNRPAHTRRTFRQLDTDSDKLARGLKHLGLAAGMRTVLMVPPSLEFFSLTFALFKLGAIPVLIDPGLGIRQMGRCIADCEPSAFIGVTKAHLGRRLLGWGRKTIKVTVEVGGSLLAGASLSEVREMADDHAMLFDPSPQDTAAILFTSGSTGPAKGAIYTHGMFAAQIEALRQVFRIEPGEVDLCTFPLFALFAPALRMTAVIPEMDASRPARVDPRKIVEAIEHFGVTNMFGSPALIDRVGEWGVERGTKLPALRRVISAGAPVAASVLERFSKLLPSDTQIFTPYGATEALPVAVIGSHEILMDTQQQTEQGAGICIGKPVLGIDVKIIAISDEAVTGLTAIEQLKIGEICVKGPVVSRGYFNRPDADALSKIPDGHGFWHRMGDLGYFDEKGRLWFCGRKSQRVRTSSGDLYTIPCEAFFNRHVGVRRSALVGVGTPGQQVPVICVELKSMNDRVDEGVVKRELQQIALRHEQTKCIKHFLIHRSFPVDVRHNAKIGREKLAKWAARRIA